MTKNKSAKLGFTPQDDRGEIIRFPGYLISADRKTTFKDCKEYTDARDIRAELSPRRSSPHPEMVPQVRGTGKLPSASLWRPR